MQGSSKKKLAHTLDASVGKLHKHQQSLSLHPQSYQQQQLSQELSHQQLYDLLPSKSAVLSMSSQDPMHFSSVSSQQKINSPCTRQPLKTQFKSTKGQQQLYLQLNQTALSFIKNGTNFKSRTPLSNQQFMQFQQQSPSSQVMSSSSTELFQQNPALRLVMNGQQTSKKQLLSKSQAHSTTQSISPQVDIGQYPQLHQQFQSTNQLHNNNQQQNGQIQRIDKTDMKQSSIPDSNLIYGSQVPLNITDKMQKITSNNNNMFLNNQFGQYFSKKAVSITPNNESDNRAKFFESVNKTQSKTKQLPEETQKITASKEIKDAHKLKWEIEENSKENEENKLIKEKGQILDLDSGKRQNQTISAGQQTFNSDKTKKRDNEGNNIHSKNTRNAHSQGFVCNASYSKSSLPSSNSTTVQNHQSHHTSGTKIQGDINSPLPLGSQVIQTSQYKHSVETSNKSPVFSKTLSTALQHYQSLLGPEGFHSSSAAKLTHSQHATEIPALPNMPTISFQMQQILQSTAKIAGNNNAFLSAPKSKHRKVASMSSASPKYGKDSMLTDGIKVINSKPQSTKYYSNLKNDMGNPQHQQIEKEKEGEVILLSSNCQFDKQFGKSCSQASKASCNHSLNSSAHNQENESHHVEVFRNSENQQKSKNVLSKITNNSTLPKKQLNIHQKPEISQNSRQQQQQKYQQQKKSLKSQSMTATGFLPISENIYKLISNQNGQQNQTELQRSQDLNHLKPTRDLQNFEEIQNENETKIIAGMQSANELMSEHFAGLLKQRIDENSYSQIMEVFSQLIASDIYFQPSLCKFKICLDSLMHDINSKMKNLRLSAAKTQQLKRASESAAQEKKQLLSKVAELQAENALLLSNSTNGTNSNQSKNNHCLPPSQDETTILKTNSNNNKIGLNTCNSYFQQTGNIQIPQHARNRSFDGPHIASLRVAEKCTQTQQEAEKPQQNVGISLEEVDQAVSENAILREYVEEQDSKLAAYKDKETRMISLLLAIKNRGVDIDEIYEKDVIAQTQQKQKKAGNNNNEEDDGDDDDEEDNNPNQEKLAEQKQQSQSKFLDKLQSVSKNKYENSSSFGDADESIVNDSDESSFNYYGKAQSDDEDSINSSGQHHPLHKEYQQQHSNMNSGRSKFEDDMKLKLRLDLSDLKKVNTQLNDEIVPPNNGQEQVLKDSTNPQYLNNGNSLSATDNKNIFIEQAYIDSNSENKHNPANNQSNIVKGQHLPEQQVIKAHKNSYKKQEQQILEKTTPMQEYLIHPQTKLSQEEIAQYIQKNDFETHQIDQHFQNNFDFEEEHENNILLGCNDQVSHERINHPPQKLVDKGYLTGQQLQQQEIDNHANVGQIWTNEKKRLSF